MDESVQHTDNLEVASPGAIPSPELRGVSNIHASLDRLEAKVENIAAPLEKKSADDRRGSKMAVATGFGLIGGKVASYVHFVMDIAKRKGKNGSKGIPSFREVWHHSLESVKDKRMWIENIAVTLASGALAALVGWARGDRIEKPSDLIYHPIDSTEKLLGLSEPTPPPTSFKDEERMAEKPSKQSSGWQQKVGAENLAAEPQRFV